jgi:hypothetical protein
MTATTLLQRLVPGFVLDARLDGNVMGKSGGGGARSV